MNTSPRQWVRVPRLRSRILLCCLPFFLAFAAHADPSDPVLRTFELKHISAQGANATLRGLIEVRRIAIDEPNERLIVYDSPATHELVAEALRVMDVAPPAWTGTLVAHQGGKRIELKRAQLRDGQGFRLTLGSPAPMMGDLGVQVRLERVTSAEASIVYEVAARSPGSSSTPLHWAESGTPRLKPGSSLVLIEPQTPALRAELGRLLGVEGAVDELTLDLAIER